MITRKWITLSIIIILLVSASCAPEDSTPQSTLLPQPVLAASPTALPTSDIVFPPVPIPTISAENEQNMVKLLKSDDCILPCYLGITPGKSTWSDTKVLLETLGARYPGKNREGNVTRFGYSMWIDAKSENGSAQTDDTGAAHKILLDLGFVVVEDMVQQIFVSIQTHNADSKFREYWSRYAPRGVFIQVGMPDAIYSTNGGGLALVYEKRGIVNIYESFRRDNLFCPGAENGLAIRRFVLTNIELPLDIYPSYENVAQNRSVWLPIEENLGVDTNQFYEQVLVDSSVCFEVKQ